MSKIVYDTHAAVFSLWQTMTTADIRCNGTIFGRDIVDDAL